MKTGIGAVSGKFAAILAAGMLMSACSAFQKENMTLTGEITDNGRECVTFRADDGTLYALANKASNFRPGDKVRVTGHGALMTTCTEAETLIVDKIVLLGGDAK
ncbi:hypothetical protein ABIE64_001534 [Thalassospira sp. MBR-102]|jgi:hypothetical protein|uniref:Lipoprotein n=2 Tax=Thalassospira TaxID=168934 RepID=A0AB72UBW2_9PROT|nr:MULTISPECIES: DUF5818 domain-containing protein [Thalassospira]AJD51830.1 hypothetical protein TH3_08560 [Thalassospira xiamenensis M-5 = DSM 17429]KEO58200.1 hypothetical protein SMB34_15110 [Thalassospira permensis NBRC 106175]MAB34961.1 hypothetical protein [Thalassospira sp.]MBA05339.1 hypothetical protein [Thalassospira sp.]MDM7976455.1 DUF5818 domain-containing protein [Thalassospira xiamenensis]|tara:strand:+ start:381 stop:692 length:312 start_codon:yes stop_codon:yes gene_type:complete